MTDKRQNGAMHEEIPDTVPDTDAVIVGHRAFDFKSLGSLCWACLTLFRLPALITSQQEASLSCNEIKSQSKLFLE